MSYFLWPKSNHRRLFLAQIIGLRKKSSEKKLENLFPGHFPVILSSGRVALKMALEYLGAKRSHMVSIFPNASHCVIDSISRVATPQPCPNQFTSFKVHYHQWGYVQKFELNSNTIEDSVDSLYIPGGKLFSLGGNYEIWSLPKILATTSGGVLWCKHEKDAIAIRKIRDKRGSNLMVLLLRILSKKFPILYFPWHGLEFEFGRISMLENNEISLAIESWPQLVEDRLKKLKIISPFIISSINMMPDRLPSNVPIDLLLSEEEIASLGIASGTREFSLIQDGHFLQKKVIPIPVHQDVADEWLANIRRILESKR